MESACKMGISFWPMFSFKPPKREANLGTCDLQPQPQPGPAAAAAGSDAAHSSQQQQQELLHVNFTQTPPDEFKVGANFLGGIPFPFLAIRTTKLEGFVNPSTGAVVLEFEAKFLAQVGDMPVWGQKLQEWQEWLIQLRVQVTSSMLT